MKKEGESEEDREESEILPDVNLSGLRELREAVQNRIPSRARLRQDAVAGLTVAIGSAPSGMAGGLLAGVNPIYGLYANVAGPVVGGLFASTRLMVINNTSAVSLVAGQALIGISAEGRDSALFAMVIFSGIFAILFGLLKMGRLIRFVSFSVMTGFMTGVAVVLILSQLPSVAGYEPEGANRVVQTVNLLLNLEEVNLVSLGLAVLTLVLVLALDRTRVSKFGNLLAIAAPSILVAVFGLGGIRLVQDVGTIEGGIPVPHLPSIADFSLIVTGAFSLAVVILVQGAGVSQTVPNPDGSRRSGSRDFVAQGVANIASGLVRGLPVGGSLSGTILNVVSGGARRWAAIFSGLWMAAILIAVPGLIANVAMPALSALLIYVGWRGIKRSDLEAVWRVGWPARLAAAATFAGTLFLPIQGAVLLGVVLSALLYVSSSSTDVRVVEVVKREDGRLEERKAPRKLPAGAVTVLDVYGHLFYAGARTLERLLPLPDPEGSHPVVVLRLRGRSKLGATLVEVLSGYARKLADAEGRLYLTGLSQSAYRHVEASGKLSVDRPVRAYEVTPVLGQSTSEAYEDAEAWLISRKNGGEKGET